VTDYISEMYSRMATVIAFCFKTPLSDKTEKPHIWLRFWNAIYWNSENKKIRYCTSVSNTALICVCVYVFVCLFVCYCYCTSGM